MPPPSGSFRPWARLLAEADRASLWECCGSYGWSGEAIDCWKRKLRDGGFPLFRPSENHSGEVQAPTAHLQRLGGHRPTALGRELLVSSAAANRIAAGGLSQKPQQHRGAGPGGRIVGFALRAHAPAAAKARPLWEVPWWLAGEARAQLHPAGLHTVAVAKDAGRLKPCCMLATCLHAQRAG